MVGAHTVHTCSRDNSTAKGVYKSSLSLSDGFGSHVTSITLPPPIGTPELGMIYTLVCVSAPMDSTMVQEGGVVYVYKIATVQDAPPGGPMNVPGIECDI